MRYIANILTKGKFDDIDIFNIVNNKDDLMVGIPTLVIGWEYAKGLYDGISILDWEIDRNTYWCYGNREKRQRYEESLKQFKDLVINRFIKTIKYVYHNVLIEANEDFTSLEFLLENYNNLKIYINNDMVYIFKDGDSKNMVVHGFSLRDYDFLGVSRKYIFKKIYNSGAMIIDDHNKIPWELKSCLNNRNYVIPCLF
jgi:DNA polymerase elongation subunit (family B)